MIDSQNIIKTAKTLFGVLITQLRVTFRTVGLQTP